MFVRIGSFMSSSAATGEGAVGGAASLLGSEADGLAIDFTDMTMVIRDTSTPSNVFSGNPNSKLSYTSPPTKLVMGVNGLLASGSTLRTEYSGTTPMGLLVEEARTNLALYSSDFTNAAWTKSNMTTAKTATGADGAANSASTLTATAGNATALQAITSASNARITSCYIKRRTGSGVINLTQDNGTTWTTVTVTSSWTKVSIASVTSTNPTVGIRIVTSGDAVDVQYFQHEVGAFVTSPIETSGTTVARLKDGGIKIATSLFPSMNTAGTMFIEFNPIDSSGNQRLLQLNKLDADDIVDLYLASGSLIGMIDNDNSITSIAGVTNGVTHKAAQGYTNGAQSRYLNGGNLKTGTLATALALTVFNIGNSTGGALVFNGYIRRILLLPRKMTNTELATLTT